MELKKCPACGGKIKNNEKRCPSCNLYLGKVEFDENGNVIKSETLSDNNYSKNKKDDHNLSLYERSIANARSITNFTSILMGVAFIIGCVIICLGIFTQNGFVVIGSVVLASFFVLFIFFITLFINWLSLYLENIAEINKKIK